MRVLSALAVALLVTACDFDPPPTPTPTSAPTPTPTPTSEPFPLEIQISSPEDSAYAEFVKATMQLLFPDYDWYCLYKSLEGDDIQGTSFCDGISSETQATLLILHREDEPDLAEMRFLQDWEDGVMIARCRYNGPLSETLPDCNFDVASSLSEAEDWILESEDTYGKLK